MFGYKYIVKIFKNIIKYRMQVHFPNHIHNNSIPNIIPPQQILQGLLNSDVNNCDCGRKCSCQDSNSSSRSRYEPVSVENVKLAIENLQQTLDAMNHQVVQVQGLLSQRDVLYHQLDHLRTQRQQIQDQIQAHEMTVHKTVKVKSSKGLKQMNERLRRRIKQVRQYIQKMDSENIKIEQSMNTTQSMYSPKNTHINMTQYSEYRGPKNPPWVQRMQNQQKSYYSSSKFNKEYFDTFRKRLLMKQQQAWERVRRQQQQIQSRNARSLMNFNRFGIGMANGLRNGGYLSPKYGSRYGR